MTIYEALKEIGHPVCHPPYMGQSDAYITYQLIGQTGTIYADSKERETGVSYAVDVWTNEPFAIAMSLALDVKSALELAGYIVTVELEYYDSEIKRSRISLSAIIAGAIYG